MKKAADAAKASLGERLDIPVETTPTNDDKAKETKPEETTKDNESEPNDKKEKENIDNDEAIHFELNIPPPTLQPKHGRWLPIGFSPP